MDDNVPPGFCSLFLEDILRAWMAPDLNRKPQRRSYQTQYSLQKVGTQSVAAAHAMGDEPT